VATVSQPRALLQERLRTCTARVAIMGLGFAGLPMAVACAEAGYSVLGLDIDPERVVRLQRGESPIADVRSHELLALLDRGALRIDSDLAQVGAADVVLICVPTPLTPERTLDRRYVRQAAATVLAHARPGQLVLLQSTAAPGTTREELAGPLAARGLEVGTDVYVAYAPERIDPGNPHYGVRNTPKLIGGVTPACTEMAALFFAPLVAQVVPCASPEVAELSKLVENTFRFVNISLVNEVARVCDRLGVDVWAVLAAAATKPFAYLPHRPGPGVGGDCIPVTPFFLAETARALGLEARLVAAAGAINASQPAWVVEKLERLLAERGQTLAGARVLVLGVAYKADVADVRESPAVGVFEALLARGATVAYHDPYVPRFQAAGRLWLSTPYTALERYTAVLLLTAHRRVPYTPLVGSGVLVLDTCNALADYRAPNVVPL
jgi:UDP-N-acetyl-D-glucosamine dehydrogenase